MERTATIDDPRTPERIEECPRETPAQRHCRERWSPDDGTVPAFRFSGQDLRARREDAGLSVDEAAGRAGVPAALVERWESGQGPELLPFLAYLVPYYVNAGPAFDALEGLEALLEFEPRSAAPQPRAPAAAQAARAHGGGEPRRGAPERAPTRHARPDAFLPDQVLERALCGPQVPEEPLGLGCRDVHHGAEWTGLPAYWHRRRAAMGRRAVRDRLRAAGHDVTIADLARWEHGEAEPTLRQGRTLAVALGVEFEQLLECASCFRVAAGHPEGEGSEDFLASALAEMRGTRRSRGLPLVRLAAAAGMSYSEAAALESGRGDILSAEAFVGAGVALDFFVPPLKAPQEARS